MAGFDGLNDTLRERLQQLIADAPGNIGIVSGFRTHDQQAALYAKNPQIAAAPGKSNHERGLAADLSFGNGEISQWVHANAARYGLFFPMSWEPWHVEALGTTRGTDGSAYTKPPANLAPTDKAGAFLDIILGHRSPSTIEQMGAAMTSKTATPGTSATGPLDYQQAYDLIIAAGGTPDEASFLAKVAKPESGYNPTAHNGNASTGDNSFGLWQINMLGQMGVDRAAKYGLSSYDDLYDPKVNARAALDIYRSQGPNAWKNSLPKVKALY